MNEGKTYDLIIVLGSKPDSTNWQFPSHVFASLDIAAKLLRAGAAPYIAVSGKWALSFDERGLRQPFLESDAMAAYLASQDVAPAQILKESESKDTVANFYYLKKHIVAPRHMRRILLVAADFRLARIEYLVHKIFGPGYQFEFHGVPAADSETYPHEAETMARTQKFLAGMASGDDTFLDGKFYDDPYYRYQRPKATP